MAACRHAIFSNWTQYAILALTRLAIRTGNGRVLLEEIAADTTPILPRDVLAKVFQKLVHTGVLRSTRGRGGGFSLARPTHGISLMDIVEAIEGPHSFDGCVLVQGQCNHETPCPQHDLYEPIRQRLKDYLMTTTLADLVSSINSRKPPGPATYGRTATFNTPSARSPNTR